MNKRQAFLIALLLTAVSLAPFAPLVSASNASSPGLLRGRIVSDRVFPIQLAISDSRAYTLAAQALTAYFRDVYMKTQVFKDTYGDIAWDNFSEEIVDSIDIVRDRKMEKTRYADTLFAFTGWIFDNYAKIVIDKINGEVKNLVIELF